MALMITRSFKDTILDLACEEDDLYTIEKILNEVGAMQISTAFSLQDRCPLSRAFSRNCRGGILLANICLENPAFKGCFRNTSARIIWRFV